MLQDSECTEIWCVRIPSVSFAASVPTPIGPSGHFPLTGGIGPLCPRGAFGGAPAPVVSISNAPGTALAFPAGVCYNGDKQMPDRREAILIALTKESRPSKQRILTVCVKLFLEQGYKKTTVAQIVQQESVSNSIFQNIFRAKDGVLTELAQFMFSNQFAMARSMAGEQLPPVYVYAVETAIQMTLTELNENLREIYIEAYTQKEASEYIFRETAKELYRIFSAYQPELTEQDFYFMEIGSAGIMRGFMAHPCDEALTLEKKLHMFLTMSLRSYHVPEDEIKKALDFISGMDIRAVSERVMHELFKALAMRFEFTL